MLNFLRKTTLDKNPNMISWWKLGIFLTILIIILPAITLLISRTPTGENSYFSLKIIEIGQAFTFETVVLSACRQLLNLALLLAFVFTALGAGLIKWIEKKGRTIPQGIVYISFFVAFIQGIIELPFSWYLGFVREKRWGFSTQSAVEWLRDYILNFGINWLTGLLIFLAVFWMIRRFPRLWWVVAGTSLAIFTALMFMIYPLVIQPLFTRQIPMQNPQVLAMAQNLADRAGVSLNGVWEEKASLKTNRANASVTGFGPTKRIVMWDTLLRDYSPDEVETVLAHELGHAIYQDNLWMWLGSSLLGYIGCGFIALTLRRPSKIGRLNLSSPHQPRTLVVVMLLFFMLSNLSLPIANTFSRIVEYRADRFAVQLTGKPEAYIAVMTRLAERNPVIIDPPALLEWILFDHPAPLNRINAIEKFKE